MSKPIETTPNGAIETKIVLDISDHAEKLEKRESERKARAAYAPARFAIADGPTPPWRRGAVGWVKAWSRYIIVLYAEDGFLMSYPCKENGDIDCLCPPVLIQEVRVKPTGVYREI